MSEEPYGYAGKILRVDLSTGRISTEPTATHVPMFLGGRAMNTWLLYDQLLPGADPLGPDNVLVVGTGPFAGTLAAGSCRCTFSAKSPLTGGLGDCNFGGFFSPQLRYAGFDHIVITGKAEHPIYLLVTDGTAEIRNAGHLWGKTTWETDKILKDENGKDTETASIGPAGENLVRFACIITDKTRAAGRTGVGAVMGSKNLKAIAAKGTGAIKVYDPKKYMEIADAQRKRILENEFAQSLGKYGATFFNEPMNKIGCVRWRNWQDAYVEDIEGLGLETFMKREFVKYLGCFNCFIHASAFLSPVDGPFSGTETQGLKANQAFDLGGNLGNTNFDSVVEGHKLTSEYGLDVSSFSGVVSWAMELYEKGIISEKDTAGLPLNWGNYNTMLELIPKVAKKEGFGKILAEGVSKASEIIGKGSEKYAVQVKGMEVMDEIRTSKGWCLGVCTSVRGPGHVRGATAIEFSGAPPEIGDKYFGVPTTGNRSRYDGKAKLVRYFERLSEVCNAVDSCYYFSQWCHAGLLNMDDYREMYNALTGRNISEQELLGIADRAINLGKMLTAREGGFRREDDLPPERILTLPVASGPAKGEFIDKAKYDEMLDEYYEIHGWDKETSLPTKETLNRLGLHFLVGDLEAMTTKRGRQ